MLRFVPVVLFSWLTACGQISRISECKRFVGLANASLRELEQIDAANRIVPEAKTYEVLAARFDRLVVDLEALKLADKELVKAVKPIQSAMKVAAEECRDYARELREHDQLVGDSHKADKLNLRRKMKKARTRVSQSSRHYESLVGRVDSLCQPQ